MGGVGGEKGLVRDGWWVEVVRGGGGGLRGEVGGEDVEGSREGEREGGYRVGGGWELDGGREV